MDAYEATKVVFSRIQALDPDHAAKIMGFLLIQDRGDKEMIRLAFGPEALLHAVVAKARNHLGLLLLPPASAPATPTSGVAFLLSRQNSSGRCAAGTAPSPLSVSSPLFDAASECRSPGAGAGAGDAAAGSFFPYSSGLGWANNNGGGPGHRRSSSVSELCSLGGAGADAGGPGWKPCLYYARGYCKNGGACRFVHGGGGLPDDAATALDQQCHDVLLRSKSQRLAAAGFPYSPTGSLPGSPSAAATKCLSLLLQQQQNENHRAAAAAAAAALILGGGGGGGHDDAHSKLMGRPRLGLDRAAAAAADLASCIVNNNPGSRQIYLTFPADSTFREEDVSNYFSIYGPVHDVRIPYQQKRMFGFVTFVYPETVRLILAKGNPHFICDARVLVKPYKEKGKLPDKYRKQGGGERVLDLDARDHFDLHQLGARMLQHSHSANEMLLRRKLEEQQAAAELQTRRLMGLHLLDLKTRSSPTPSPIGGMPFSPTRAAVASPSPTVESPPPDSSAGEQHSVLLAPPPHKRRAAAAVNGRGDKEESGGDASASPDADDSDQSAEHNLPDSPFASPTKSAAAAAAFARGPFAPKPYFFPMSRLSSDHGAGAIGM